MTQRETERLAALEQKVTDMAAQLVANTQDTKAILEKLNNLSGAQKVLMWATGVVLSIGTIIATWSVNHK